MKNKVVEWTQFSLMFYTFLIVMTSVISMLDLTELSEYSSQDINCIVPIYNYSGTPAYESRICITKDFEIAFFRLYEDMKREPTVNQIVDIAFFSFISIAGFHSWLLYLRKRVGVYIPWIK